MPESLLEIRSEIGRLFEHFGDLAEALEPIIVNMNDQIQ